MPSLTLISHPLCPYVQRAVISLSEKAIPFKRIDIDLSQKPDWFKAISPLGKTPVLKVGDHSIFESAVILEYLEETRPHPLHPADPLARADHRAWMEFGSAVLNDIAGFYSAPDEAAFEAKVVALEAKFARIEQRLGDGLFFDGDRFSLVDAVFGPAFRYFDVFDLVGDFGIMTDKPKTNGWRSALAARPSVASAVGADYNMRLEAFLRGRQSHLARLMR
ncbi:MAG TPA: glutathione S-transferase family protein [Rhizobium sp.]|nr:glutathione S-transferase family protein [Rhizobium sp.]